MIRPLDDRVVIEPMEAEEKTQGGIVLPDTAKEKPMKGKIIAVGDGKMLESGKRAELLVKREIKSFMESTQGPRLLLMVKNIWL